MHLPERLEWATVGGMDVTVALFHTSSASEVINALAI